MKTVVGSCDVVTHKQCKPFINISVVPNKYIKCIVSVEVWICCDRISSCEFLINGKWLRVFFLVNLKLNSINWHCLINETGSNHYYYRRIICKNARKRASQFLFHFVFIFIFILLYVATDNEIEKFVTCFIRIQKVTVSIAVSIEMID